jgi:hypothetical protein
MFNDPVEQNGIEALIGKRQLVQAACFKPHVVNASSASKLTCSLYLTFLYVDTNGFARRNEFCQINGNTPWAAPGI